MLSYDVTWLLVVLAQRICRPGWRIRSQSPPVRPVDPADWAEASMEAALLLGFSSCSRVASVPCCSEPSYSHSCLIKEFICVFQEALQLHLGEDKPQQPSPSLDEQQSSHAAENGNGSVWCERFHQASQASGYSRNTNIQGEKFTQSIPDHGTEM